MFHDHILMNCFIISSILSFFVLVNDKIYSRININFCSRSVRLTSLKFNQSMLFCSNTIGQNYYRPKHIVLNVIHIYEITVLLPSNILFLPKKSYY